MFHKKLISLAVGTALCSFGIVSVSPTSTGSKTSQVLAGSEAVSPTSFMFGLKIAGIYYNRFSIGGASTEGFVTLHADGTYTASDTNDLVPGDGDTPVQGQWTRTGKLQLTLRQWNQNFDINGNLQRNIRATFVGDLAPDLQSATFAGTVDIFVPGQDITDPNTMPVLTLPITGNTSALP